MKTKIVQRKVLSCLVAVLMVAATLVSPGTIFADDTTGDGEVSAEGTEVTEEVTEEATEEATQEPTEEVTEEVTEEATTETTETPTEVSTGEPTSTQTPTQTATETPTTTLTETPTEEATLTPTVTPTEEMLTAQDTDITLISPNGTLHTTKPTFSWYEVDDAIKYYLYVSQSSMDGDIKQYGKIYKYSICDDSVCTVTPSVSLALGHTYTWRIRPYYADGIYGDFSEEMEFTLTTTTPSAQVPSGTIYEDTPNFKWSEVTNAEQYQILVYDSDGNKDINLVTSDFTCEDSICSIASPVSLDNDSYKWRVRAYYSSKWRSYSSYLKFIVASDIDSDFDSYDANWTKFGGSSWLLSSGTFYTSGKYSKMSSVRSQYKYFDYTLEARVKREAESENGSYPANFIAVRMGSSKTSSQYLWYPGYLFGYTNAGTYSVWRMGSGGSATALQPWTYSSSINKDDWNDLKVVANEDDFEFYINDDLVYSFTDSSYSSGYVGFEMYRSASGQSKFLIDSVKVTRIGDVGTTATSTFSAEQQSFNLAAQSSASSVSVETYDGASITAQDIEAPTPVSPVDATLYTAKPTFTWNAVDGAEKYYLYLAKITVAGTNIVYGKTYGSSICTDSVCSVTPPSKLSQADYQWKVKAYDGSEWGDYSAEQYFTYASTTPTGSDPYGTIYDNTPTFTWSEVVGTDQVNLVIYNSKGKKLVREYSTDFTCTDSVCSLELSDYTFNSGTYKWRLRVEVDGTWGGYSKMRGFTVGSDFESDFEENSTGWSRLWGAKWNLLSSGYYYTKGSSKKFTSAAYAYTYEDFEFEATVMRDVATSYSSYPASYLAVHMAKYKSSTYRWYTGYIFGYTNAGNYSIWRMDSKGSATAIQPWTYSSYININDWNDLKVVVEDDVFDFYINGELVYNFTDDTYTEGYVGFEMYLPASYSNNFYVDYAKLTLLGDDASGLSTMSVEEDTISMEQEIMNQMAREGEAQGSIEGYPTE